MVGLGSSTMGKGDKRTKRGKLFKHSFGKRRMKTEKVAKKGKESATAQA
jgi:ribosomal small subunit protein bTHX